MLTDRNKLRAALSTKEAYKTVRQKTTRWNFMNGGFGIEDGSYQGRLYWAHPEKCPDGYITQEFYRLEMLPEDGKEKAKQILCPDSCVLRKMQKNYFAERIVFQIAQRGLVSEMSDNLKAAASLLVPEKRLIWPLALWGQSHVTGQRSGVGKNAGKTFDDIGYKPGKDGPFPIIWTAPSYTQYCQKLVDCICAYEEKHGVSISDPQRGAMITVQISGNVWMFVAGDPSPASPQMLEHYSTMYDISKNLTRMYKDPEGIYKLFEASWIWKPLKKLGLDLRRDDEIPDDELIPDWKSLEKDSDAEVDSSYSAIGDYDDDNSLDSLMASLKELPGGD